MKCPNCNGTGKVEVESGIFTIHGCDCVVCYGTGVVEPLTNEEWFCGLPTEEKAEFLVMIQMSVMHPVKRGAVDMEKFIEKVVMWLKQPHKE